MSDDRLDEAIAAYTDRRPAPPDAAGTRTRLLRSALAAQQTRRRRVVGAFAVALLATNATTWAWSSGQLRRAWTAWGRGDEVLVAASDAGPAVTTAPTVATPAAAQIEHPAVTTTRAPPTRAATALQSGATAPKTRHALGSEAAALEAPALEAKPPAITPDPLDYADRITFEAAHRAHFERGADAVALAAWDAYLAGFPTGRFVPEATFNRAICLVRLGDTDAARPVLEAIAASAHGTAHVEDARALLAKLR
jgi:hypothetical protein